MIHLINKIIKALKLLPFVSLVFFTTILFSCNKHNSVNNKNKIVNYIFPNQQAWLELKKLLANDLISAQKLGIVDCRGLKKQPGLLSRKNEIIYSIFGSFYQWETYQTKNGICIKVINYKNKVQRESFFINIFDARVLLSASKAYHFEELGLEKPHIVSKTIFLGEATLKYCKTGGTRYFHDKMIYKDSCIQQTIYSYKGGYPDLSDFIFGIGKGDKDTLLLPKFKKVKRK